MRVIVAAPAKVNLRLVVGGRDASGYHELDTLFCALHLADTVVLDAEEDPGFATGFAPPLTALPDMGASGRNLAVRAARAFQERAGLPADAGPRIRLVKRIPAGGGLGGGSSDAAAVLRGMRRLHPERLEPPDLLELARGLGSDVAFFLLGVPLARGLGRGDRLQVLDPLPARPVVVVIPPFGVSTADAYRWIDEDRTRADAGAAAEPRADAGQAAEPGADAGLAAEPWAGAAPLDWDLVAERARNDFEPSVFRRRPALRALRDTLLNAGARPALLSGSGSTVFGIFGDETAARAAADRVRAEQPGHTVLVTRTRTR
ncbi:MAG: 4-(cytidine 5'-diphospho)-2-C-methyl-D-erythritol kinase [Gemmatimonadota bacterium]